MGAPRSDQDICPDCFASANKGNGQYGTKSQTPCDRTSGYSGLHIGEVNRLPVEDGTPDGGSTRQGQSGFPNGPDRRNVPACETMRSSSPSFCRIAESWESQRLATDSTSVSRTLGKSNFARLITLSTSAVAAAVGIRGARAEAACSRWL
jgi:hypothetical protein